MGLKVSATSEYYEYVNRKVKIFLNADYWFLEL